MNYRNELERALNGKPGELDGYLECHDETEVAAAIRPLIGTPLELRDEFAMAALPSAIIQEDRTPTHNGTPYSGAAALAYLFADAMLAARSTQKEATRE